MTITVLPMDATAGAPAYSAKNARQAQAALYGNPTGRVFGTRSGWRVGTLPSVVSVTSTTWTLNPSACMIEPAASLYQGCYGRASDAVETGAMTAADGTNPRIDILYIQVNDSSAGDGSGGLSAPVGYLAGDPKPAGTQVAPTLPPRSFLVATIAVPKIGGGAPTVTFNQTYFVAAGGVLPIFTQAERDALTPYPGFVVCRLDLGCALERYDGTTWHGKTSGNLVISGGYQAYGSAYDTPSYVKNPDGRITLAGLLGSTATIAMNAGTLYTLANLPSGSGTAPAKQKIFPAAAGPAIGYHGDIYLQTNGTIQFMPAVTFSGVSTANFYVSLEGIGWWV